MSDFPFKVESTEDLDSAGMPHEMSAWQCLGEYPDRASAEIMQRRYAKAMGNASFLANDVQWLRVSRLETDRAGGAEVKQYGALVHCGL